MEEERRRASELRPCEADDTLGVLGRVGNYLGSWMGLSPVSEHEGGLNMPHKIFSCTLKLSGVDNLSSTHWLGAVLTSEERWLDSCLRLLGRK